MKSTAFTVALTLLAVAAAANAQTGRPSAAEVHAPTVAAQPVVVDGEPGSYARYLMLNGVTRDEAIVAAQHIDHPAARKVVARRDRAADEGSAPVRQ